MQDKTIDIVEYSDIYGQQFPNFYLKFLHKLFNCNYFNAHNGKEKFI